jgi:hypothetical protein
MSANAALEAKESNPGRFPNLLQARCPNAIPPLIELASQSRCMTPSEYIRRSVMERLQADGFDPATIAPRDAGSLYNVIAGDRHWALVVDGAVKAMHRSADKPEDEQGGIWLPIEYEDSEPFDDVAHWRMAPVTSVEAGRVVRTYPVISKTLGAF